MRHGIAIGAKSERGEMKKSPAFLILAHEDQPLLTLLVSRLLQFGDVYLHIDSKSPIPIDFMPATPKLHVYKQFDIRWGHWSMVEATIFLADEAVKNGATYLSYLSGITLPICSNDAFEEFLNAEEECFEANKVILDNYPRYFRLRFTRRYIAPRSKRNLWGRLTRRALRELFALTPKLDFKRLLGDVELCHGIGFWSVTSTTYLQALEIARSRPSLWKYFRSTEISDETFFATLFAHVSKGNHRSARTFVEWVGSGTPAFINDSHLNDLSNQPEFVYARKFSSREPMILNRVKAIWGSK